ncbi:putative survival of motor neuron-related-splicing factor 30-like [Apostichopus japonicus]|uniref:Putative survival of motor neuron-related-splicing factor 30-like n=1 Tax=Stichopus japonicus TaxID=307972 RepID=A0A2G8KTR8_STIJA|nr:putative survival of motor neuron-related-splicing factor 30-like [Apostichopus japonicus]
MGDSDEYNTNLQTYKAQLQQVEAALTNDPENEELLKLQGDLQEVIDLTQDLVKAAPGSALTEEEIIELKEKWKVGDKCQAIWSKDGDGVFWQQNANADLADGQIHWLFSHHYNAVIDEIMDDGKVTVTFEYYDQTEVNQISKLKQYVDRKESASSEAGGKRGLSKKQQLEKEREYKKRRQQKKADRQKNLEELHEKDKKKWQNFNTKNVKNKKGFVRKSIFSSPETVDGKVGVGTCGTSGQPMTKFKMPKHVVNRK